MNDIVIDIIKRTAKTMCQCALGYFSMASVISEIDWLQLVSATAVAGITCILMNAVAFLGDSEK